MSSLRLPKLLLMLLLLFGCFLSTKAQNVTVTGKVTDKETGKPIEGVSVKVKNNTTHKRMRKVIFRFRFHHLSQCSRSHLLVSPTMKPKLVPGLFPLA
jgi:hypothetical protein